MISHTLRRWAHLVVTLALAVQLPAWIATAAPCPDCNADGTLTINELVLGVNIALGTRPVDVCASADIDRDGTVAIHELVSAIRGALYGCPSSTSPTPTPTPVADDPTPTATSDGQLPPTEGAALVAWLQQGSYRDWQAESGIHPGAGPHFGRVRTFVNDALFASLTAGTTQHPSGAAAVKELYGGTGDTLRGWAVMRKVQDDSDGGRGWYWYEHFNGGGGGGIGDTVCTGCHSVGRDFIRIPFPLQ